MKNKPLTISRIYLPIFFVAGILLALTGCDREEEPIPAYVEIKPFVLEATDPGKHGSISHKITNGDIFFIDQNDGSIHSIGTVTLPATIPVIATGEQEIIIDPVIKGAGNSFNLQIYPFYERFSQKLELAPNGDVSIQPKTTYISDAVFEFIEDFEGAGHRFQDDQDGDPDTFIEISTEDVFEGSSSGKVHLDTGGVVVVAATTELFGFDLSEAGRVFMEVNYKTDVPLEFGIQAINNIGQANSIFEFVVLAKDEWNKIYFDMTNILLDANQDQYAFIFRAALPIENGVFTLDEADIFLDNIKVVHF